MYKQRISIVMFIVNNIKNNHKIYNNIENMLNFVILVLLKKVLELQLWF